jgi:hypothetical protein
MKHSHKKAYVEAIVKYAQKKTKGKTLPVVYDGFHLFDRACRPGGLVHPYSRGESRKIILAFADEVFRKCYAVGIVTMKIPARLLEKIPNGGMASIDENRTPEWYGNAAMLSCGHAASGLALFGPKCVGIHPMLLEDLKRHDTRQANTSGNYEKRIEKLVNTKHLDEATASELLHYNGRSKEDLLRLGKDMAVAVKK